ncbi:MAG: transketolase, partial [Candidatus Kerfeldbacteria bacterium]|nr:transketolase [Candidatus Kerfeldbacteria bacterium]
GGFFRANLNRPKDLGNDQLIFSKGHAAPLLYALYAAAGKISRRQLMTLRKYHSPLSGHPMSEFPYTVAPTGSLGQGLSVGAGISLANQKARRASRVFVLLGDGEMAEGQVWEAMQFSSFHGLNHLVGILDVNRLGQSGPTMLGHNMQAIDRRIASFGWRTVVIDGHDLGQIKRAFRVAVSATHRPTMIIARTIKGKGVSFLENKLGWHGRALSPTELPRALDEIGPVGNKLRGVVRPAAIRRVRLMVRRKAKTFDYEPAQLVAPRLAVGQALDRLAPAWPSMVVLDGDVANSTFTELIRRGHRRQFLESYIAEQNMVSVANGLAAAGLIPVTVTFAAFLTRAFDQLRMAHYASTHQIFIGSHIGVSIGQDGPSQMGLEDIAMFRTLGATILYPSDAVSGQRLTELALAGKGMVYLRSTRAILPVLYKKASAFRIGGSAVLRRHRDDRATIVAAGVTLHEALRAADDLQKSGVQVRVIDLYSIQPLDVRTVYRAVEETKHLIVVEDHVSAGGIAEAVRSALGDSARVISLAVRKTPRSGSPEQLLADQGIDAPAIKDCVLSLL